MWWYVTFFLIGSIASGLSFHQKALFNDTTRITDVESMVATFIPYIDVVFLGLFLAFSSKKPIFLIHVIFLITDLVGLGFEQLSRRCNSKIATEILFVLSITIGGLYSFVLLLCTVHLSPYFHISTIFQTYVKKFHLFQDSLAVAFLVLPVQFASVFYFHKETSAQENEPRPVERYRHIFNTFYNSLVAISIWLINKSKSIERRRHIANTFYIFLITISTWLVIDRIIFEPGNDELEKLGYSYSIEDTAGLFAGIVTFLYIECYDRLTSKKNIFQNHRFFFLFFKYFLPFTVLIALVLCTSSNFFAMTLGFILAFSLLVLCLRVFPKLEFDSEQVMVHLGSFLKKNFGTIFCLAFLGALLTQATAGGYLAGDPLSLVYAQMGKYNNAMYFSLFRMIAFSTMITAATIASGILPTAGLASVFTIGYLFYMHRLPVPIVMLIGFWAVIAEMAILGILKDKIIYWKEKYEPKSNELEVHRDNLSTKLRCAVLDLTSSSLLIGGLAVAQEILPIVGPAIVACIWAINYTFPKVAKLDTRDYRTYINTMSVGPLGAIIVASLHYVLKYLIKLNLPILN